MSASLETLKLGVLLPSEEGQFRADVERGIDSVREELAAGRVRVVVRHCKTDIPQEALSLLGELEAEGCKGLAVCALNDRSVQDRVTELTEKGIPCVTFNSDLPESGRLCFVGQDIRRAGRVAAELMSKCVSRDAVVLAAVGNLKFDGHRQRLGAFRSAWQSWASPRSRSWWRRPSTTTRPRCPWWGRPSRPSPAWRGSIWRTSA